MEWKAWLTPETPLPTRYLAERGRSALKRVVIENPKIWGIAEAGLTPKNKPPLRMLKLVMLRQSVYM